MEDKKWFNFEGQKTIEELMVTAKGIIADSDADEFTKALKEFAKKSAESMKFMVIGDSKVGKTSLLNSIFAPVYPAGSTNVISEVKYGVEEASVEISGFHSREFVRNPELEGITLIDTPGVGSYLNNEMHCGDIVKMASESDVIFAVFDATNINDFGVWEMIEKLPGEKLVFVMTKCDLAGETKVDEAKSRLKMYLMDEGIDAPVFCISNASNQEEYSPDNLIDYIGKEILKGNPVIQKQEVNLQALSKIMSEYRQSYSLFVRQHEEDLRVVESINSSIDDFREKNRAIVEQVKAEIKYLIEEEVDHYRDEIIERMDPKMIRDRFPGGYEDYIVYLDGVNENYKHLLTDKVSTKSQEAIQAYVGRLETVFDEATGYIRKRESLVSFEDQFYGGLMKSRDEMVVTTNKSATELRGYYRTLSDASGDLFLKVWESRNQYDKALQIETTKGSLIGAGAGLATGAAVIGGTATLVALSGVVLPAVAVVVLPVAAVAAGIAAGTSAGKKLAKNLAKARSLPQMEAKVNQYLMEYQREVAEIRVQMVDEVLLNIDRIFGQELGTVDRHFAGFRIAVAEDDAKIPQIDEKLKLIGQLSEDIDGIVSGKM